MKYIKTKWTVFDWLKIGYCNWEYFKDRKQICYNGKMVLFQWSQGFAQSVSLMEILGNVSLSHIIDK